MQLRREGPACRSRRASAFSFIQGADGRAAPPWLARPSQQSAGPRSLAFALQWLAGARIEQEPAYGSVMTVVEIEHMIDLPGDRIEGDRKSVV